MEKVDQKTSRPSLDHDAVIVLIGATDTVGRSGSSGVSLGLVVLSALVNQGNSIGPVSPPGFDTERVVASVDGGIGAVDELNGALVDAVHLKRELVPEATGVRAMINIPGQSRVAASTLLQSAISSIPKQDYKGNKIDETIVGRR